MKLVDYLGHSLKSDEVIDLIETNELTVTYNFDLCRENAPDEYLIADKANGFEMRFDETQKLIAIFCHVVGSDDMSPVSPDLVGVPILRSLTEARAASEGMDCNFTFRERVEFLGDVHDWARLEFGHQSWHYQFQKTGLNLITLMTRHPT